MKIIDVLTNHHSNPLDVIRGKCDQYLAECSSPLFRNLSIEYSEIQKVKVRHKKVGNDQMTTAFNQVFISEKTNIRQKAIFANGTNSFNFKQDNPYYIFPINGFKYMYSKEVKNSSENYKNTFGMMVEHFDDHKGHMDTFKEVLKYTYCNENLQVGVDCGAEIILFNIPCYYAVRVDTISYNELLSKLEK